MRALPQLLSYGALLTALAASPAHATRFWLGGEDPVVQADKHKADPADYMDLFRPDAPWQQSAARLTVFKLSTQFVTRAPIEQLSLVIQDLRRRHIALGLETGVLAADRGCGRGEGYSPPGQLDRTMRRILQAGGTLGAVAFDGIVFHGREKNRMDRQGHVPCQDSLEELARETAAGVALIHSYFPAAAIGAIEQISGDFPAARLVHDYLTFADLYRAATGRRLAFFHSDIVWNTDYQAALAPLKAGFQARAIPFGVIIGGNQNQGGDAGWVALGLQRLATLHADPATAPEDIVIQSWQPLPTRMLPETDPGSLTYLLSRAEMMVR